MRRAEEAVDARRQEWMEILERGDLAAYADLVTEDVVWLPPRGEPIRGREAFTAWLRPFLEGYRYRFRVEPAETRLFDGWCAESGTFRSVMEPRAGGEAGEHGGRYTLLWRRDPDGVWRIERYVDGLGAADRG